MNTAFTAGSLQRSIAECHPVEAPFRHWRPRGMLDGEVAVALSNLEIEIPPDLDLSTGRREANNKTRLFFDTEGQKKNPAMKALAEAMQAPEVVAAWEKLCGIDLTGTYLRIEYCRDTGGFWLEPHTDIGAKLFTMLVYLSNDPGSEAWGTDLLDGPDRLVLTTPYQRNVGCIFIPSADSWHGFRRRPIVGVRRSLIVNYVRPEWRSRHELAFPDQAISC